MLFDELVAKVGAERYREACERARATAAGTGRCGGQRSWAGELQAVPPQFADAWWHTDASLRERLETALRLYADMPCYANTVALHTFYGEFGEDGGACCGTPTAHSSRTTTSAWPTRPRIRCGSTSSGTRRRSPKPGARSRSAILRRGSGAWLGCCRYPDPCQEAKGGPARGACR